MSKRNRLAFGLLMIVGCAGAPRPGPEHPANPAARSAQPRELTDTLPSATLHADAFEAGQAQTGGTQDVEIARSAEPRIYICPMDPEVVSDKPGECPICGMELVLKAADAEAGEVHRHE